MGSETPRQASAMQIAAAGKSNIGIPKKVGQEFHAADEKDPKMMKKAAKVGRPSPQREMAKAKALRKPDASRSLGPGMKGMEGDEGGV